MSTSHPKWKVLSQEDVSPSKWFPVLKEHVELPSGQHIEYFKSQLANVAMIVPVTTAGEVIFVRQYKHGIGEVCVEFPAGRIENGKTAEQTAVAELREETGIVISEKNLIPLGELWTEPSKSAVRVFGFLVKNVEVTQPQHLEDTEQIEIVKIPLADLENFIQRGEVHASDTLALIHLAQSHFRQISQNSHQQ